MVDTVEFFSRQIQRFGFHQTGSDENRVVPFKQVVEIVGSQVGIAKKLDSQFFDAGQIEIDDFLRKPEGRDAEREHATGLRRFLEYGDFAAFSGQFYRTGQRSGPGTDTGDFFAVGRSGLENMHVQPPFLVGDETLEFRDFDRRVQPRPGTGAFAQFVDRTDAGTARSQRIVFPDGFRRSPEVRKTQRADESGRIGSGRAGGAAWSSWQSRQRAASAMAARASNPFSSSRFSMTRMVRLIQSPCIGLFSERPYRQYKGKCPFTERAVSWRG